MLASLCRWPLRLCAALLLAVLCAQALPHQPISTADVTLPPGEGETAQVCTLAAPCPDKRLADAAALPRLALAAAPATPQRWAAHRVRGPPLRPPPRSIADPRGPPHLI